MRCTAPDTATRQPFPATAPGLSLDEVRDVLADDAGRELAEVPAELDADLARQQAELAARRQRLALLLAAPPGEVEPLSPALAALLAKAPATDSPSATLDREHLTLLDGTGAIGDEVYAVLGTLAADPAVLGLYERLDELVDAPVDDPRIVPLGGPGRARTIRFHADEPRALVTALRRLTPP